MTRQERCFWRLWDRLETAGLHPHTGPAHSRCRIIDADPRSSGLEPLRVYVTPAGNWTDDECHSNRLR